MSRKLIPVLLVLAILLTACSNPSTPQTVEVTRVVEVTRMVEVTRVVEAPAQPAATVAPATPAPAPPAPQAPGFGETLKKVTARGKLICGVNSQVPGFGFVDSSGAYAGFDVDFCKALAAAIFNDVSKIEYRPVTAEQRFPALQSGEIDVLIRNTTWTLVRDTDNGGNFVATTFYDGQGMMVPKSLNATKLEDLASGTICVQKGTTTELNLADQMTARKIQYTPAVFDDANSTFAAYAEASGVYSQRLSLAKPDDHMVLPEIISKEPLGPVVRHGDDQWFDIVKWTVFATIAGEEFGVTTANVTDMAANPKTPEMRRLLGADEKVDLGAKLGLSKDRAVNVIKAMGNYDEIYDRNLGPATKTAIPRGLNSLYANGGLLYSPPFR